MGNDKTKTTREMKNMSDFMHCVSLFFMKYIDELEIPVSIEEYQKINEKIKVYPIKEPFAGSNQITHYYLYLLIRSN